MHLRILSIFCLCCWALVLQAQTEGTIQKLSYEGLKKTKEAYLEQFIITKIGDTPNKNQIEEDVQTLKNKTSIAEASYRIDTLQSGQLNLVFQIKERRTLLPITNFGGIRNNFWFQVGFRESNWSGKGQNLFAYYQYTDQRHSGKIYYRVPFVKNTPWGYSFSLSRWASVEPLYFPEGAVNYNYDYNSISGSAIRFLGLRQSLEAGVTFFEEKYKKSAVQELENPVGPDNVTEPKLLTKFEYRGYYLDYDFFYIKGHSWFTNLQQVYNIKHGDWFHSFTFQGRQFFRIGGTGNLAMRGRLAISTNNNSPFAPFVLDSYFNIRGVGNRIDRGTAQAVLNIEYRQTVFAVRSRGWGGQVVAFSDMGTWRTPGGKLKDMLDPEIFRHFVGGGFRLIYQNVYGATFRIDYGIDIYNTDQRGFVIGLGQYF